jgi:hydrogenase nickel incorporation protein HypB
VADGAEKPKKYPVMFHKADVVILNKTDLATASGVDLRELETNVREVNPKATVFAVSCKTGAGLDAWLAWLRDAIARRSVAAATRT